VRRNVVSGHNTICHITHIRVRLEGPGAMQNVFFWSPFNSSNCPAPKACSLYVSIIGAVLVVNGILTVSDIVA
jgi:hypothetical protein